MIGALICLVIAVTDGDTLKVRCGDPGEYQQITIRLAEIDAPEKKQAFGQRSKSELSKLCFGVAATIRPLTADRYGRTVARVECGGADASEAQVQHGMAWRFLRYSKDPRMQVLEDAARVSKVGLWSDAASVPPWEWRKGNAQRAHAAP